MGPEVIDSAVLPSDFGGNIAIRFETACENVFPTLDQRLKKLCTA
jgi:hypothetical protein